MNKIKVVHLDRFGKPLDGGFVTDFNTYKKRNKGLDWDAIVTGIINNGSYTTVNIPYGNITFSLVE